MNLIFCWIFDPGLVPLDPDRNSVHNGGVLASGTLIWTALVPKTKVQRTYISKKYCFCKNYVLTHVFDKPLSPK